jgi:LmeA-like phospholipid-binding
VSGTSHRGASGRSRRGGCLRAFIVALVALVILLVAADFIAKSVAQGKLASEIQQHGFPKKPSVSIQGFPFLTQVVSRNIHQVKISSQNIPEGPVNISQVTAVMKGIHLNSGFTSGTVSQLSGSVLVTFPSLAKTLNSQIGPLGALVGSSGLTLSAAGSDEIKASLDLLVASGSATWRITRISGQEFNAKLVNSSGVPSSVLGSISSFNIKIPQLPLGMQIDSVHITPEGVVGAISGHNLSFGG